MASDPHREAPELLSEESREMHRALLSLGEELEAIDWYQQRAGACADPELKAVLLHNRAEEIEHAAMLLEWLRRRDGHFGQMLKTYLFTDVPITGVEKAAGAAGAAGPAIESLGIGSMRGK